MSSSASQPATSFSPTLNALYLKKTFSLLLPNSLKIINHTYELVTSFIRTEDTTFMSSSTSNENSTSVVTTLAVISILTALVLLTIQTLKLAYVTYKLLSTTYPRTTTLSTLASQPNTSSLLSASETRSTPEP